MDARAVVESEVRELIRRRGVDPMDEPETVRHLIHEVVADYEDRSASGAMPIITDPTALARQVYDAVAGFGQLQPFLEDPEVEEIWINDRLGHGWLSTACRRRHVRGFGPASSSPHVRHRIVLAELPTSSDSV